MGKKTEEITASEYKKLYLQLTPSQQKQAIEKLRSEVGLNPVQLDSLSQSIK